jgi:hypothetical protein
MVDIRHPLLTVAIPLPCIFLIRLIEIGVGAEGREERRLIVGRASEPPIGQPRPGGDGIAPGDELLGRPRGLEIAMGKPAPFGRAGQNAFFLFLILMQRIVEASD